MVPMRDSGDPSQKKRPCRNLGLIGILIVSGCVSLAGAERSEVTPDSPPPMGWDHRPEAAEWTRATLLAVSAKDPVLADTVPSDIAGWCPAYAGAGIGARRAFWAGLLSSVARYESSWNPQAAGGGGRWIGLMQISPRTAATYGCGATSAAALKDGSANLQCAVKIMADQVGRDGVVARPGNRGLGRDWMPLRDAGKRDVMAAWIRVQPYCAAG